MSKLKKIKKLIGHRKYIEPIVDPVIYPNLEKSYAGGSLADSNILIVSNEPIEEGLINEIENNENASISFLYKNDKLSANDIIKSGNTLIGPYNHIINVYKKDGNLPLLSETGDYPNSDDMYKLYQWLQEETDYLVNNKLIGTICTIYIGDDSDYGNVLKKNMEMFALSLGDALANHSIINNGIIANTGVRVRELLNTAVFMSSKYGQILGGAIHLIG